MTFRALTAALALATAALAGRAADDENPYKSAKVGDYAKYSFKAKLGPLPLDGTLTQTVAEKTDKDATIKLLLNFSGMDTPVPDQKIDLTKPFDPTKGFALPGLNTANVKLEKLKDGQEKVKVGDKEYEATWTTYKVKVANKGTDSEGDLKVWVTKDVPMALVKMTLAITVGKNDVKVATEMTEFGSKK